MSPPPTLEDSAPQFSPLYRQIADRLTARLDGGEWKPGEAIPSELDLAARFKVSQGTVRKAIDALAAANLVVRRQGRGTFVATHAEEGQQFRFLRLAPDAAPERGAERPSRRIIDCRRQRPSAEVARALDMPASQAVFHVQRVLLFGGRPVVLDDLWLPVALFKGLTAEGLRAWPGPLYGYFEREFGVHMVRAEEQLRAVAADAASAELLQVAPGSPLLEVLRTAYTYDDRPVELRRGLYDTRSHHYRNALS
jgi:GntR family transcriptional regulator